MNKVREIGSFPEGKELGEAYHCELCEAEGNLEKKFLGYKKLQQCPKCGRWVCESCSNEENVCKLCTNEVMSSSKEEEIKTKMRQIETEIKSLRETLRERQNGNLQSIVRRTDLENTVREINLVSGWMSNLVKRNNKLTRK